MLDYLLRQVFAVNRRLLHLKSLITAQGMSILTNVVLAEDRLSELGANSTHVFWCCSTEYYSLQMEQLLVWQVIECVDEENFLL